MSIGRPTYNEIIDDVLEEIAEYEKTSSITPETIQKYILDACQRISLQTLVMEKRTLRLIKGVEDYAFADSGQVSGAGTINCSDRDVTGTTSVGTGTISTSGTTVTGSGTLFKTELSVGKVIIVGSDSREVMEIKSDTECVIDKAFNTELSGASFSVSSTKFTRELAVGSTITSNSVSRVIESIISPYQAKVTEPYVTSQTAQAFTIDTKVTEIPTRFHQIYYIDRREGSFNREIKIKDLEDVLSIRRRDYGMNVYTNLNTPFVVAQYRDVGGRFLKFYPAPDAHKDVTIYGYIRVNPRNHTFDALSSTIPLSSEYEPAIREYVKYRIFDVLKIRDRKDEALANFTFSVRELKLISPNSTLRQKITYM